MATLVANKEEIAEVWVQFKLDTTNKPLRNRLVEQYLPLVKYNGERIWARLPDGVELDDLISAGVFGLMDAINAFDGTVILVSHDRAFLDGVVNKVLEVSPGSTRMLTCNVSEYVERLEKEMAEKVGA